MNNLKFNSAIVSITDACNLKCKYCFVEKHPHYMSQQTAKDIIDLFLTNKEEEKNFTFFGGEPTLLWDEIIVPTVEYAKEKQAKINFSITSNGILLDEDKLKYMKDNDISLLLSMDGDKTTQDYNRPLLDGSSSFDILKDKLQLILKYLPDTTIRGTIYPESCMNLYEDMNYFWELGFKNLFFCPDEFSNWSEEQIYILKNELRKYTIYFLNSYKNLKIPVLFSPFQNMLYNVYLNENITKPLLKDCEQCGLGKHTIAINYEGKIFSCQELSSYTILNNPYYIGDIYNGINEIKINSLIKKFNEKILICEDKTICQTCNYKNLCNTNYCHANSYLKFKNFYQKSKIKCIWDQFLFQDVTFCITVLFANNNEFFKQNYFNFIKIREEGNLLCCQNG